MKDKEMSIMEQNKNKIILKLEIKKFISLLQNVKAILPIMQNDDSLLFHIFQPSFYIIFAKIPSKCTQRHEKAHNTKRVRAFLVHARHAFSILLITLKYSESLAI